MLFTARASRSQRQPQSAPQVSEGLARRHPCLPGFQKDARAIFVLANQTHENWVITEFLFGGGNLVGQLHLHFNDITLMQSSTLQVMKCIHKIKISFCKSLNSPVR